MTITNTNVVQGFSGSQITYLVSGAVGVSDASSCNTGVTMTFTGGATAITDGNGNYSLAVVPGTYTITPSKLNCSFSPVNTGVTVTSGNVTAATFTGFQTSFSISGVVSGGGSCTNNVQLTLSGAAQRTTWTPATGSGTYAFSGLAPGSYTVTPTYTNCTFSPSYASITITNANATANFSGSQAAQPPWANSGWSEGAYGGSYPNNAAVSKFTFSFQDALGPGNIQMVAVLFLPPGGANGSCNAYFYSNGYSYMVGDNGTYPSGYWGQNGILHNSQCDIDLSGTRLYSANGYLYLDLAVLMEPAFQTYQNIWLSVLNNQGYYQTPTWLQVGFSFLMTSSYSFQIFWTNPTSASSIQQQFTVAVGDYLGASSDINTVNLFAGSNYTPGSNPFWCWVSAVNFQGSPPYFEVMSSPSGTGTPFYISSAYQTAGGTLSTPYCSLDLSRSRLDFYSNYGFLQTNLTALSPLYGMTTYLTSFMTYTLNGNQIQISIPDGTWYIP